MNILIKLTCLIGLVIAPILGSGVSENKQMKCPMEMKTTCCEQTMVDGKCSMGSEKAGANKRTTDKKVTVEISNLEGKAKATVTTTENGNATTQVFQGSLDEVKAKIDALK